MIRSEVLPLGLQPRWSVALYFALTFASVAADRLLAPLGFVWAKIALPIALTLGVLLLARRYGAPARLLGLRRSPGRYLALALVAGSPSVAVVLGHAVTQGSSALLGAPAGLLVARIALNQAWLEELLARGYLLGALLVAAVPARRAAWISAACFALMHVEQFLLPPITAEGLVNGAVLVVLTLPMGLAFARLTTAARSIAPAVLLHFLIDLTIVPQKLQRASTGAILVATLLGAAIVLVTLAREGRAAR